jgi:hypothetical protein
MGVPILDFYYKVELNQRRLAKNYLKHIDLKMLILEFGCEV